FPQLGAPVGFLLSGSVFLLLSHYLTDDQFFGFGWRIPFLASAVLVVLGLYVRLSIAETPVFQAAVNRDERVNAPMLSLIKEHPVTLVKGVLISIVVFTIFYLMTVFSLSWGVSALGYTRDQFLMIQLFGILFFAATIPLSAVLAERGRRKTMMSMCVLIALYGL